MSADTRPRAAGIAAHARHTRDVVLNGLGWVIPAALALVAIPALTRSLGPDRFGLLALAWAAVSVFAILDLGLGRAVAILVAERQAKGTSDDVAARARAASDVAALTRAAGVLAWAVFLPLALLGLWLAPWIVQQALELPPMLTDEAVATVRLLSLALPVVVHGILLRAVLEGQQRFVLVNALRIPLGIVTWGGPWIAAVWTQDVRVLALVIVGGRAAYWLGHLLVLRGGGHGHASSAGPHPATAARLATAESASAGSPYAELFARGSWITLSGIISPILTSADRLVVPLVAPIAAVGWYVAAGEAATKLWLVTAALTPVLASALAAAFARADLAEVRALLTKAAWATGLLLLPPAVLGFVFAEPLLTWWLADTYAPAAVATFRVFVVAVYANSLAQIAYAGLQATGRARSAALLHVAELPVFLGALWWLSSSYGVTGAAWAWAGRLTVDAVLMIGLVRRRL